MAIKCILYSEFHPVAGPMIAFQDPKDFPIQEAFDAVHDLIITKPQLYNRFISVDVGGYRIIGCPKSIEDNRYERNALIFNFVLVFERETVTTSYEPVVQKLGESFRTYEVKHLCLLVWKLQKLENGFLSCDQTKCTVPDILSQIRNGLNTFGISVIRIDDTNTLHLRVMPILDAPPTVHNHHVPIFICPPGDIGQLSSDITIQEIVHHIDGFNHVAKISELSEVNNEIAKECVQHLVIYGFVKLLSIFQYSNVYVAMRKLPQLMTDELLQKRCIEHVALKGNVPPLVCNIFRLLSSLEAGLTVKDVCFRNDPSCFNINERKLIQFGLMEGLIRHLQKYPVLNGPSDSLPNSLKPLLQYLDGSHCYDEICCEFAISNQKLDELLDTCTDIVICWK